MFFTFLLFLSKAKGKRMTYVVICYVPAPLPQQSTPPHSSFRTSVRSASSGETRNYSEAARITYKLLKQRENELISDRLSSISSSSSNPSYLIGQPKWSMKSPILQSPIGKSTLGLNPFPAVKMIDDDDDEVDDDDDENNKRKMRMIEKNSISRR